MSLVTYTNRNRILSQATFFMLLIMLAACSVTRYVPEDQYLLSDIDLEVDNINIEKDELASHLRQKENLKILGILKMHLWLYSLSRKDAENGWLKKVGEAPVIYDEALTYKSKQQLKQYLDNKGYYKSIVSDSVIYKRSKAKVSYRINTGQPYLLNQIQYNIKDPNIALILQSDKSESLLKSGDIFDVDVLEKERQRISKMLKNKGYFRFAEEFIHFSVDTSITDRANVTLVLERPRGEVGESSDSIIHKKYKIADYSIYIDNPKKDSIETEYIESSDLLNNPGFKFYSKGIAPLKKSIFYKSIETKPGDYFQKKNEDKTYNNLYALRQFKFVNIQYQEDENSPTSPDEGLLHGKIMLPLQVKQNYSIDLEGTNSSGNLGVAGNINYQHRNLFGGAEVFDVSFKGASERRVTIHDNQQKEYNTIELGGQARLTIPTFLFPIREGKMNLYSMPFTTFSLAYNYQNRPYYYNRTIVNATAGYTWKSSARFSHFLNVIDLNAVRIPEEGLNPDFINQIKDLLFRSSYTDHMISSTNYSLVFNDQGLVKRPDYHYFRMNVESAGNFLRLIGQLAGKEKYFEASELSETPKTYYKYFNTRFAQYFKLDFDFRYGYRFDKYNSIATRAFSGFALPYGNFNVIPFEKRYFTGGANGIRAWQVRSLGPGSNSSDLWEFNQSADIKLEANIEYRFRLFWMVEGAFFLDGGNIWAINKYDNRDGAQFEIDRFYKEFALGTGFGLRFVSSYFIFRTDLGLKLRDPSLPIGERFIPTGRTFNSSDLNFNIAIGYPF